MNKIYIIMSLLACLLMSCNNDDKYEMNYPTPADTMHLTASSANVVLDGSRPDEIAVSFRWNPAAQREEGVEILYYFKYWLTSAGSKSVEKIDVMPETMEYSLTNKQLLNYLDECEAVLGETVEVEAEIIADIQSTYYMKPEVSKTLILVSTDNSNIEIER